jgi:hypothetical protein
MAELKSGLLLNSNETLVLEIEAELWATSSNPIAQLFGGIRRFFAAIFGYKKKGFVVVTNQRVVIVEKRITCYCFDRGKIVKYILPSSLKEVGYKKFATCGCFCPAYHLYFDAFTEHHDVLLKGVNEAGAQKVCDTFYQSIVHNA